MHTQNTVQVMVIAFIGGRGSLWGGAVAAYPFFVAMEMLRSSLAELPGSHLVIYGFFLVLIMIYYPGGIAHLIQSSFARFRSRPIRSLFNGSATTYQLSKQQRELGNPDVPRAGAPEGEEER
jgi:branched-chain amino acid transport system permease protein